MSIRLTSLILAAAFLCGCATPLRLALTPQQRASIAELETKVIVVQDEVIVDVKASNATGAGIAFGLIGALISTTIDSQVTNSRVKSAQELMGTFYAAIEDVDFRAEFNEAVRPALANYPIKVSSVTTTPLGLSNDQLRKWREALQPGQNLMLILPRYTLSADFRTLDAETWVTIWSKGGEDRPINRSVLRYQSAPVGPGDRDSMRDWSANNALVFRSAIKEAVSETMALVRTDLNVTANADQPAQLRDFSLLRDGLPTTLKGNLVADSGERLAVLGEDGKLYSLPKMVAAPRK